VVGTRGIGGDRDVAVPPRPPTGQTVCVGIREQLADPWGFVAGGLTGGMAGAVTAALAASFAPAIPVALGVGAVVYGVKVGLGVLAERNAAPRSELPMPAKGSPAEVWLRRAEKAVRTLHDLTVSPADAVTREQVGDVDDRAAETLGDLRRLAAQVAAVDSAARTIDVGRLRAEEQRIAADLHAAQHPELRAECERSLRSVTEQLQVYGRLLTARDTLIARMQATAIGLEGLIARLAEVLALAATAGGVDTTAQRIADLTSDLDGMQAGLRETEALSRSVLARGGPVAP
jgi:hypothetical protein